MKTNLARLNHILLPSRKDERDRMRRSRAGRLFRPLFTIYNRLSQEGRVLATVTFIAGGLSFDVARTEAYLLFTALLGLIGGSLFWSRLCKLSGVQANVVAPRQSVRGELATFRVEMHNQGDTPWQSLRVEGPFLPWDGRWIGGPHGVATLAPGERARVDLKARFLERGEHHLDTFQVVGLTPMGLAQGPALEAGGCRFVVVPVLANVVHITEASRRASSTGGAPRAARSGTSMDLHGVRPYRPGDMVRDLHARTWARVGYPAVREYQEEQISRVGVVLDLADAEGDQLEAMLSLTAGIVAKLLRTESSIVLAIPGESLRSVEVGRGGAPIDVALDVLGRIKKAPARDAIERVSQIEPMLPGLASMLVVRRAEGAGVIAASARRRGIDVRSALVRGQPDGTGRNETNASSAGLDVEHDPSRTKLIDAHAVLALEAIVL